MEINRYIDHTLLKPEATEEQIRKICAEAREYGFASVCVNACHAELVAKELRGTDVKTCVVVGFPLGATLPGVKAFEAMKAVEKGASEIDMVINIGALKSGKTDLVKADMESVIQTVGEWAIVKVILECCLLTGEEIRKACELAVSAGAHYVKTSTGFSSGGATLEDVRLMKEVVGGKAKVKAAGGIRTLEKALAMIEAGADRIGASAGVAIVKESRQ
jgi:deoxyribose-phosphate aldolase